MKYIVLTLFLLLIQGCTPSIDSLQPTTLGGQSMMVTNVRNYDQVWNAINRAMADGYSIMKSHKPSGTIKAKYNNENRIIGVFISPTISNASRYDIYMVTKKTFQTDFVDQGWDPQLADRINNEIKRK
jgi:hypothetical protein